MYLFLSVVKTLAFFFFVSFQLSAQSFQQQTVAPGRQLTDIQMVTSDVGYVGGVDGVYKTTDGGQTWVLLPYFQPSGNPQRDHYTLNFNVVHLVFQNEWEGIAYGWHSYNNEIVMRTQDGGISWSVNHFEAPQTAVFDLHNLNTFSSWSNNLLIAGNSARVLRSTDGGEHWTGQIIHEDEPELKRIQQTSATRGYAAGGTYFFTSANAGANWSLRKLTFDLTDFYFFNEQQGIAADNQGYFYKTTDGGLNWTRGPMQTESAVTRLIFATPLIGYGTTSSGLIYKTADGGNTWLRIQAAPSAIISSSLVSADHVWVALNNGYLLHTTNGGAIEVSAPALTAMNPVSGAIGDQLTLTGSNFGSVVAVKVNGTSASFRQSGGTSIVVIVPPGASTGKVELVWPQGSVFSAGDYTVSQAPKLYALSPNLIIKGSTVIIQGENLMTVTQAHLDGVPMSYTTPNNREISFLLPFDFPRAAAVFKVTSPFGQASMTVGLGSKPHITNTDGAGAPGQYVIVSGNDLLPTSSVRFGNVEAWYEVLSNTQIRAKVPEVTAMQTTPIVITGPGGTTSSPGQYTIYPAPVISLAGPLAVRVGEEIKIEGDNLPTGTLGRVWFNQYEVHRSAIRYVDRHTLYVKTPSLSGGNIVITVANEGGLTGTKNVVLTIAGQLANRIDVVDPISTRNTGLVTVKGIFGFIDSLTVNGKKHVLVERQANFVSFFTTPATTSGVVTLYDDGIPFSYKDQLVITDHPAPRFDFSPKVASPGMQIMVTPVNLRFVNSVHVNGRSAPFDPAFAMDYVTSFSFTVTNDMTSGTIKIKTPDGEFEHPEPLQIKPPAEVRPVITAVSLSNQPDQYLLELTGHNFSSVTAVRFDQFNTGFTIVDDEHIRVEPLAESSTLFFSTQQVIVEAPAGQAYANFGQTLMPTQTILSATPASTQRGSFVTVKLSPKKDFLQYSDYYTFYFGTTATTRWEKIDDVTYRVEVPVEGDVEGKIGIHGGGTGIFYSTVSFSLLANAYCDCRGSSSSVSSLKKVMIQGNRFPIANVAYIDNSSAPFDVFPGQALRVGVIPSTVGVLSKIFVDWDGDKDFDEPGALMVDGNLLPQQDSMIYYIMKVPDTAVPGAQVKMRFVNSLHDQDDLKPCGIRYNGQAIDYQVNIVSASSALKVIDFYPSIGTTGTEVTVTGDNLHVLQSVTLNGLMLMITPVNVHTVKLTIPEGATPGHLVFNTATETRTTSRKFAIDNHIVAPTGTLPSLKYAYRATLNGKDIAFHYVYVDLFGYPYQVFPVAEFPEDGTLCVYTPGGRYCFDDPVRFPYAINFPEPFNVQAGVPVTLTGSNLLSVTQLSIVETGEAVPFTATSNSITFTPPATNSQFRTLWVSGHSHGQEREMTYVTIEPPCDPYTGWTEGGEIVKLKFQQLSNASGKNVTGGRSSYTSQQAIVDRHHSYYVEATVKNFSSVTKYVQVNVIINGTQTLGSDFMNYQRGGSEGVVLAPGEEKIVNPYFYIPADVSLNQPMSIWFLSSYYSYTGCESRIGEIEEYSIVVKENPLVSSIQITSLSASIAQANDQIDVNGTGFDQVKTLQLGDDYVPFTIISPSLIQFAVPVQGKSGKVVLTALSGNAESAPLKVIRPHSVSSIDPPYGRAGDFIRVHGTNFDDVTTLAFDDVAIPASHVVMLNSNTIQVKVTSSAVTGPIRLMNSFDETVNSPTFYFCDGITPNMHCKGNQQIAFNDLPPPLTYGASPVTLTATANSGLPVIFTSSNLAVATVSGNVLTIVGGGTTTITARQDGNDLYFPAPVVQKTLVVNKADQTITFSDLSGVEYGHAPFTLQATASSSLPVTFSSANSQVAQVLGNTVTIVGAGSATITCTQAGNASYHAATAVQTLVVGKATQAIDFGAVADTDLSSLPLILEATATSGLNVTFSSASPGATVVANSLVAAAPGAVSVTASQAGNNNYQPALPLTRTFCIRPPVPVVTLVETPTGSEMISSSESGNRWYKDGIEIVGATANTLPVTEPGKYKVQVMAGECASNFSDERSFVITGTERNIGNAVFVYPNPTQIKLFISAPAGVTRVSIIRSSGVSTGIAAEGRGETLELDVSTLANGMYILELRDNDNMVHHQKFIKQ